jgi:glycosyltransferase involved in cell wall biosynthesis
VKKSPQQNFITRHFNELQLEKVKFFTASESRIASITKDACMSVSIIIPVHNRAALAEQAIASVGPSAGRELSHEIIVVDDGSTLAEAHQLASCCNRYPNCRYIRLESNRGAQIARNEGLEQVNGKYVKFLDSDDCLLPGALADEYKIIERNSVGLVISGWLRTNLGDNSLECAIHHKPATYAGNPYDAILSRFGAPISAVLYRKTIIGSNRWDTRVRHPDDWFFLIKILLNEPCIMVRDAPVFIWREHSGPRLSNTSIIEYARARFLILDYFYQIMQQRNLLTPIRRKRLGNYIYRDIYVAHRFDQKLYNNILARLEELNPAFSPDASVESRFLQRILIRMLGYQRYVPIHNMIRNFMLYSAPI